MKRIRSILIQYRIVLYVLYPLVFLVTLVMAIRGRDSRYLLERIGIYRRDFPQDCMWFHAASVGEVNGVMPLLIKMANDNPSAHYLLTTGTPTGGQLALKKIPGNAVHAYLPLDYPGAVRRFLKKTRPTSAVIMETELWADLFYACDQRNIPISIINARLSDRTLKTNAWMYRLYAETLSHVSKILARSDEDANGFMTIGATSSKIKVLGNLKYAPVDTSHISPLPDINRPYVLAASTHENEEEILTKLWVENFSEHLLVIAPRHPKRRSSIIKSIKRYTDKVAVRSSSEKIDTDTIIYLADTLGELQNLIVGAEIVFMGGSLINRGGHNVIEPARFGKPILFGSSTYNFREETKFLLENQAALQVADVDELIYSISKLLHDKEYAQKLGENAISSLSNVGDVVEKYIKMINLHETHFRPVDL